MGNPTASSLISNIHSIVEKKGRYRDMFCCCSKRITFDKEFYSEEVTFDRGIEETKVEFGSCTAIEYRN